MKSYLLKKYHLLLISLISVFLFSLFPTKSFAEIGESLCVGKVPNPVSDICWSCMFPIKVGPVSIGSSSSDNRDPNPPTICRCPAPPPLFQRIGVGVSFWEPARIAEVVREPMCMVTLGGSKMGSYNAPRGTHAKTSDGTQERAFYHVHWVQYPVLNWLGMAIKEGACFNDETFDVAYMSELDPLWDEDELSMILSPEVVLFANTIAQVACVADSVTAIANRFGLDELFWCSGSQGSVYPISGSHAGHTGGIDSSLAITHGMIFKLHREFLAQDTSTNAAICGAVPQPVMRKTQYKQQMLYPIPFSSSGWGLGAPSIIWGAGREFPYRGEDYSYLIWRKVLCCAW